MMTLVAGSLRWLEVVSMRWPSSSPIVVVVAADMRSDADSEVEVDVAAEQQKADVVVAWCPVDINFTPQQK